MHCPNCRHILTKVDLGNIEIEHCNNCGSSLFETNEINRITLKDAERLALMKATDVLSGSEKISPRDGSTFERLKGPSIPEHITILHSPSSGEVFTFPEDLLEFKKAQDAKVNYYKTWKIPMPSMQNVLVFSFVLLSAFSLAYATRMLQEPQETAIQAQSVCQDGIGIIPQENAYLVSCTPIQNVTCSTIQAICNGEIIEIDTLLNETNNNTLLGSVPDTCNAVRFVCGDEQTPTDWIELR